MEIKKKVWFDNGTKDATFSIATQEYLIRDGAETPIGDQHREAVTPLDLERIKEQYPALYPILKKLWTPTVVENFKKVQEERLAEIKKIEGDGGDVG